MKRLAGVCLAAALALGLTERAVRAHVEFLADDLLEGRETGTRGYDLAARHVATQLALLGLAPAGEAGSFFQQVPLVESRLSEGTLAFSGPSGTTTLVLRDDFSMTGDPLRTESRVEAPVVLAGYDNALGSAVVLEVARVLAGLEKRPRRSLLFLFVTGEERGLLGSDYFASQPTVPPAALVANVNIDMPLLLYPLPAVYFSPGMRSAEPAQDGAVRFREFLGRHYHRPSDNPSLAMDLGAITL